jgi:DNA-binding SARP family transcriptional activator
VSAAKFQLATTPAHVRLTEGFDLQVGARSVAVPHGSQRLLAFLALARQPVTRSRIAGQLWLDLPESRALGNLRSALWRLRLLPRRVVQVLDNRLALAHEVDVDLNELTLASQRLIDAPDRSALAHVGDLIAATDVLSGWEDDWLVVDRERFRELRLHALEHAGEALMAMGNLADAALTALAVVAAEPLRESAQRLLIQIYVREGNRAEALRRYREYRKLMAGELDLAPSELMEELVVGLRRTP